ncbi:MAG TPA: YicC/YloC family endoribonuclease [Thermoanaerobaculia bacterium]|nr:YicC/YloC family endoribonuclease [Thermoanaerobaculia bacterium]
MIHSMTGFGRSSGALSARYFATVTTKSVNHRFLEVSVRLPEYLWDMEAPLRALASEFFSRGKVDLSLRVQRTQQPEYTVRINAQLANTVIPQLRSIAEELGLGSSLTASDLMRVPDLLQVEPVDAEVTDEEREALLSLTRDVFTQMRAMREREGVSLRDDIAARVKLIRAHSEQIAAHRDDVRAEVLANYQQRVQEIAAAAGVDVAQDRIAQEVVIMVEKGDIAEELTRLAHHLDQIEKAIGGKEAAGKKLDFLSQEMIREINTMGSKSRSAAIRTVVVELKTEVERIREQVQNVE